MSTTYRFTAGPDRKPRIRRAADKTNELRVSTYVPRHAKPDDQPAKLWPSTPQVEVA